MEFDLKNGAVAYGYSSINNPRTISKIEEYNIYDIYSSSGVEIEEIIEHGNLKNTVILNENEPFVYIMSDNANKVIFYDLEGDVFNPTKIIYE